MDLFKWAMKLFPYVSSSLISRCLEVAIQCRVLDMRASPYDTRSVSASLLGEPLDMSPVPVETSDGRREYAQLQEDLYQRSLPLRKELLDTYSQVITMLEPFSEAMMKNPIVNSPTIRGDFVF